MNREWLTSPYGFLIFICVGYLANTTALAIADAWAFIRWLKRRRSRPDLAACTPGTAPARHTGRTSHHEGPHMPDENEIRIGNPKYGPVRTPPGRRGRRVWPYVAALVVALAGVSAALIVVLLNKPGDSKPAAAAASPSTSPSPSQTLDKGVGQMGRTQTESDDQATVTVTVYAYRVLHSANPPDRKGYEYGGADVRGCVVKSPQGIPIGLSWNPWSVAFADDTTENAAGAWSPDDFQVPLYPASDRVTKPGHCVRGWILFEVPKGKKPAKVVYAPEAASAPTEWAIP